MPDKEDSPPNDTIPTLEVLVPEVKAEVARRKYGTGWRRDPYDKRDYPTKKLFGAHRNMPREVLLELYASSVRDQLSTGSCVGQAIARAVDTRMRAVGTPIAYPSALAAYGVARALERMSPDDALVDVGSQPRLAMKGIRNWGLPPDSSWPLDESKVNDELPLDVLEDASAFKLDAWYRIDSVGRGRVLDVCQALSEKHPVILGVDADRALMDYDGTMPLVAPDESKVIGGHMLCLLGYRTMPDGKTQLRGANSWGTDWGDSGYFWATEEWLTAGSAGDIYVIVVTGA